MDDLALGRLAEKVDQAIDKLKDIETRMRSLEKFKWKVAGAAIVAGSSAGVVAKLVG